MSYWKDREDQYFNSFESSAEQVLKRLDPIFEDTKKQIQKDINEFLGRYADKNGITREEARKRVDKYDVDALKDYAFDLLKKGNLTPEAEAELKLYNLKSRMSRLEALNAKLDLEVIVNYSKVQDEFQIDLTREAIEEYTRQSGILGRTIGYQEKNLATLVNQSFYGATWSERLWGEDHAIKMRKDLGNVLSKIIVTKDNPLSYAGSFARRWEKDLGLRVGSRTKAAKTLLISEAAKVQTDVKKDSYIKADIEMYQYYAEPTACEICKPLDGKIFLVSEMEPGVNAKPMHPYCYCGVLPQSSRESWLKDLEARAQAYSEKEGTSND